MKKSTWNIYPDIKPADIPETEDFGIEYEVKYKTPNGEIKTMITEWLWKREWNCIYPVIAWKQHNSIISFAEYKSRCKNYK